jgi:hypothetical protein
MFTGYEEEEEEAEAEEGDPGRKSTRGAGGEPRLAP